MQALWHPQGRLGRSQATNYVAVVTPQVMTDSFNARNHLIAKSLPEVGQNRFHADGLACYQQFIVCTASLSGYVDMACHQTSYVIVILTPHNCDNQSLVCSPDGEAKVGRPDSAVVILIKEEEVVGFDIAVDDAFGMTL